MSGDGPAPARTALVTGASRGIGRHLALGLAGAGLDVAVLARDEGAVQRVASELRDAGVRAAAVAADVTDLRSVEDAVRRVEEGIGPLDLLVNNAGRIDHREVAPWEADPDDWWGVVETNVRGAFHLVRTVVPGMLARGGGRVVDLSTGSAIRDSGIYSAYHASKTALLRFGSGLHLAGADAGLRTFEVSPGVVRTDMTASMGIHEGRQDWTDPSAVVDLVVAVAAGRLDDWSGRFLRAGTDEVDDLRTAAGQGLPDDARTLRLRPWGPGDPVA